MRRLRIETARLRTGRAVESRLCELGQTLHVVMDSVKLHKMRRQKTWPSYRGLDDADLHEGAGTFRDASKPFGVLTEKGRAGQINTDRLQALARLYVIRLPVGARFPQSVEVDANGEASLCAGTWSKVRWGASATRIVLSTT